MENLKIGEVLETLRRIQQDQKENGTQECDHREADHALCSLLAELGCQEVVEGFEKIEKWYA